jgi:aspartate kinase
MIIGNQRAIQGPRESRSVSAISPASPQDRGAPGITMPGITVQKYGGSSLATVAHLRQVARRVVSTHSSGRPTVVVVSAPGRTTDELLRLADVIGLQRTGRETDQLLATGEVTSAALLAIAVQDLGIPAVSLTGAQAGIRVVGKPGSGVIADIDTRRLLGILADGAVAVVAGFQGCDDAGDVITLGRGGSDTTAVALAAVLRASRCEIRTDVPGVATTDPRVVHNVRILPVVDVGLMAEMSFAGAKVLHSRAVELAAMHRVELHIGNSHSGNSTESGTIIPAGSDRTMLESRAVVVAIAHDLDVARVLVRCGASRSNLTAEIFAMLSQLAIPVDLVARSGPYEDEFRMGFTMPRKDIDEARSAIWQAIADTDATIHIEENVGKVSVIGMGLLNRPEYTARMLATLAAASIPTSWLSTSQLRTSVVIPTDRVLATVQLLHDEFGLDRDHLDPVAATSA